MIIGSCVLKRDTACLWGRPRARTSLRPVSLAPSSGIETMGGSRGIRGMVLRDPAVDPLPPGAEADDAVESGARHEDHVSLGAGLDRRHRPAGAAAAAGSVPRARAARSGGPLLLDPPDAATPAVRHPVGALENHQRAGLAQAAGQPFDLLSEDAPAGLACWMNIFGSRLCQATSPPLGRSGWTVSTSSTSAECSLPGQKTCCSRAG